MFFALCVCVLSPRFIAFANHQGNNFVIRYHLQDVELNPAGISRVSTNLMQSNDMT